MPVVVEFFGLPGVGKTFLAEHLIDFLKERGYQVGDRAVRITGGAPVIRISTKIALLIQALLVTPNCLRPILALLRISKVVGLRAKVKLVVNWLYLHALIRRESSLSQVIVLDQGLAQAVWSTLFYGIERPQNEVFEPPFGELLAGLEFQSLFIIQVHAPGDAIKARIESRNHGKSPLDNGNQEEWSKAQWVTGEVRSLIEFQQRSVKRIQVTDISNQVDGLDKVNLQPIFEMIVADLPRSMKND